MRASQEIGKFKWCVTWRLRFVVVEEDLKVAKQEPWLNCFTHYPRVCLIHYHVWKPARG